MLTFVALAAFFILNSLPRSKHGTHTAFWTSCFPAAPLYKSRSVDGREPRLFSNLSQFFIATGQSTTGARRSA